MQLTELQTRSQLDITFISSYLDERYKDGKILKRLIKHRFDLNGILLKSINRKKDIKLHEAMIIGCLLKPKSRHTYFSVIPKTDNSKDLCSCAIGACIDSMVINLDETLENYTLNNNAISVKYSQLESKIKLPSINNGNLITIELNPYIDTYAELEYLGYQLKSKFHELLSIINKDDERINNLKPQQKKLVKSSFTYFDLHCMTLFSLIVDLNDRLDVPREEIAYMLKLMDNSY